MTFYRLRHLHMSYLLAADIHPEVVSKRRGHATAAITDISMHQANFGILA